MLIANSFYLAVGVLQLVCSAILVNMITVLRWDIHLDAGFDDAEVNLSFNSRPFGKGLARMNV